MNVYEVFFTAFYAERTFIVIASNEQEAIDTAVQLMETEYDAREKEYPNWRAKHTDDIFQFECSQQLTKLKPANDSALAPEIVADYSCYE